MIKKSRYERTRVLLDSAMHFSLGCLVSVLGITADAQRVVYIFLADYRIMMSH